MGKRVIPRSIVFICDRCSTEATQEWNASEREPERPQSWGIVEIETSNGGVYAGSAHLLCETCLSELEGKMKIFMQEKK